MCDPRETLITFSIRLKVSQKLALQTKLIPREPPLQPPLNFG